MKMIYTQENRLLVSNAKNLLEQHDIEVILKNEFNIGALGESPAFGTWLELWVVNAADEMRALELLTSLKEAVDANPWTCPKCAEENAGTFSLCWNCESVNALEPLET